ncbi:MAG TPA: tRNA (N6-isopentenyl adenosine(37)-C2)-methylthiotransferase MiaB [Rickettsiales bacterium]|nr:tRNA (N6-isopentenyl adenosine(37)-C2)-methylthiotransferase MiaB [Rickettsiales bacterium]
MKKIFAKSFGCQMNVYDTSRILDIMKNEGYEETLNLVDADLIVINTCSIREKAKEKIFSELGRINEIKKNGTIVVVAGCVAQTSADEIKRRMKMVDIIIGPASYHKLPELVRAKGGVKLDFLAEEKFKSLPQTRIVKGVSEMIAVQEGCDKFCSYCIVPFTRGREYSRDFNQIIDEAKVLKDSGVKEITLLGQNVDNYKFNGKSLADIIFEISKIEGIERIRYMTSYPSQVNQDLIDAHGNIEKLMPFIHLPIQSGSNKVLKAMNRRYTVEQYLDVVDKLRKSRPDIAISSDFIVGFAGETDKDFEETLELCKKVNYSMTFSFKYSIRPDTAGEKMLNQVDENIKSERLDILQELLETQQAEFNKSKLGQNLDVLIESLSDRNDGSYFGKSPYLQTVLVESDDKDLIGKIVKVKIDKVGMKLLEGIK